MNDPALFFTCSLIEKIGRMRKLDRETVVHSLGEKTIRRILTHADVLHREPIEKVADDFITLCKIPAGEFDNIALCKYAVPDVWTIGKVYARLIDDVQDGDIASTLIAVYSSWLSVQIQRFNSDLFYQPRDYLAECWRQGKIAA